MGLDLWFREDVARILASSYEAMTASTGALPAADAELARVYRQGYADAIRAVAIAFGVAAPRGALPPPRVTGSAVHIVEQTLWQR